MMLTKAILLGVAILVNIAVGTAPRQGPSQLMNVTSYKHKPQRIDKPLLDPPVLDYSEYLVKELLHKTTNVVTMWNDSKINYECKKIFIKEGYKVEDIEMFEVLYEDCYETPWVMCRHKEAWYHAELIKFYIGLIPVNVRQFNRHFIALPADDKGGPDAYNDYDSVVFKGQASLHSIVANAAKSMGKYTGEGWPVWDTTWWRNAIDTNATAVMNPTSQISMEECFGQFTVLAISFFQRAGIDHDRIRDVNKIWPFLWEYQTRYGLLFMVQRWTFCVGQLLEDSPVGLPDQLPNIEV